MGDYFRPMTKLKARKQHRCECCYYPIATGEVHCMQTGYYEGDAFRNRFHVECWDALDEDGDWEFSPGSGEPPERLRSTQP